MNPDRLKHLEFLQAVVTRMAGNSFLLKGWTITIIAALFALAAKDANAMYVLIAFVPAIFFWLLDAFYLHQERLFRALYDATWADNVTITTFSMDTRKVAANVPSWFKTIFAPVELLFYLPLLGSVAVALYLASTLKQ